MSDKVFLDTNVLVYAYDVSHPAKKERAEKVLTETMARDTGVISSQVLGEFFVTVTQRIQKPLSDKKALDLLELFSNWDVMEVDATMVLKAIEFRMRWKISYWDSLILAAAHRSDCHTVLSENFSQKQKYGTIRIRNIFSD